MFYIHVVVVGSTGSGGIQSSGMGAERLCTNSGKSSCVF
jgi:hypothetical protein